MTTPLVDRVRQRLVSERADVGTAVRAEAGGIVDDAVLASLHREVTSELTGAGPLEPLLALRGVSDVLVNAPDSVWLDRGHGLERAQVTFPDDTAVRRLAQRLAAAAGRRLDDAQPFVDATLVDGTRLHAVLPPLCPTTTLSLRVLAREPLSLAALAARGTVPADVAEVLGAVAQARLAFVVTGGTGAGKTTLLGAMLGLVAPAERLVVIEDAAEIVLDHPHAVRLVTRTANVEGAGAIGLRDLVRQSLRMRPDRLVVGEFRGAEMVELLVALNTGHEGGAADAAREQRGRRAGAPRRARRACRPVHRRGDLARGECAAGGDPSAPAARRHRRRGRTRPARRRRRQPRCPSGVAARRRRRTRCRHAVRRPRGPGGARTQAAAGSGVRAGPPWRRRRRRRLRPGRPRCAPTRSPAAAGGAATSTRQARPRSPSDRRVVRGVRRGGSGVRDGRWCCGCGRRPGRADDRRSNT